MMTQEEMILYDYIVEMEVATPNELNLVRNLINGTWREILNGVLFVRTGYKNLGEYLDSLEEEDE